MKKFKSCMFLLTTVLFSVSALSFDVVPPDKGFLEVEQSPIVLNQVEVFDLDVGIDLEPEQVTREDEAVFSRVLSLNRGTGSNSCFLVPAVDKFAVVQNQNFDRMHRF